MMFWAPSDKACLKSGVHNINAQQGGLMAADARSGRCILYAGAAYIIQSSKYPKYNIQSSPPKYPSRSDGWIPSRTPMQWHKSRDVDICRDLGVRSLKLLLELRTYFKKRSVELCVKMFLAALIYLYDQLKVLLLNECVTAAWKCFGCIRLNLSSPVVLSLSLSLGGTVHRGWWWWLYANGDGGGAGGGAGGGNDQNISSRQGWWIVMIEIVIIATMIKR